MATRLQDDFDDHVNGEWKKSNTIPDDQTRWGSFMILREDNFNRLKVILEEEAAKDEKSLVGALYSLAKNPPKEHSAEILALLNDINSSVNDAQSYLKTSAKLFTTFGVSSLMHVCKSEDAKNPEIRVPHVIQAGLGLPDKSYYTEREDVWDQYKQYLTDITAAYGFEVDAAAVFELEKKIAEKHLTRVQCRDPDLTYNKKNYGSDVLTALPEFFSNLEGFDGNEQLKDFVIQNNDLLPFQAELLKSVDAKTLRDQLIIRVCDKAARFGTEKVQEIRFNFRGKVLDGQKTQDEPWKKAMKVVEEFIGDELGKLYVAKHFPKENQEKCLEMVDDLRRSLKKTLSELEWMEDATKAKALEKLNGFGVKIGVPEEWHEIDGLWPQGLGKVTSLDAAVMSWYQWDWTKQEVAKFYTPPERKLWHMTPQTVNAYYHPEMNEIVFPAGILQKPFFGFEEYEKNIGAIGVVIGHEMTHGFDDQGRKYDAKGVLQDWWTEEDSKKFDERASVVKDHYGEQLVHGKPVNGALTLGENIADIGGLKLALRSLKDRHGGNVDRATYDNFFKAYAEIWRMLIREETAIKFLAIDPHSPSHLRVNCALGHIDEFYTTYDLVDGDKMFLPKEKRMNIW